MNLPVSVSEGSSREVGKAVSEETGTPNTAQNAKYGIWRAYLGGPNMVGGVSLKRSCNMQFRRGDLRSIGLPNQKL